MREKHKWLKHIDFIVLDLLAAELALFCAVMIRFDGSILFFDIYENYTLYQNLAFIIVYINLALTVLTDTYHHILRRDKYQELRSCAWHTMVNMVGILAIMYATQLSYFYSRTVIIWYAVLMFVFTYIFRVIRKKVVRTKKNSAEHKHPMLLICDSRSIDYCLGQLAYDPDTNYRIAGICITDQSMTGQHIQDFPVVTDMEGLFSYIVAHEDIREVYIDDDLISRREHIADMMVEQGLEVHIGLVHNDTTFTYRVLEQYGDTMTLTTSMLIASNRQAFVKRLMDIMGALVGLVFTAIAFVIFAPIIKIQSPGPVFFSQTRIGRGGRKFKFYKFRSMYMDAEERKAALMAQNEMQGFMFKMENDPRIFPIGHFIRKYSIDELPQFWNVLKGDMSLVGTRPPLESEYAQYELHHKARLAIKPGLTGMWQVSGRSDITDFEDVVRLDTEYIANWSVWLDIKILFRTVMVVVRGSGSR